MSHDTHIQDGVNKDYGIGRTLEDYLEMTEGLVDMYGPPVIDHVPINQYGQGDERFIQIVRDDTIVGSKARFGQYLFQKIKEDTVVYVQPRKGLAGVSIIELAKLTGKKVVLFMPACKEISDHQAVCIERGAIPKFRRIAAMPVLNKLAKEWAAKNGAFFIPLGLYHPLVVAGAVRSAYDLAQRMGEPKEVWSVVSTGVLTRGLQIAWPNADFHAVAVARNMKAGELGRASVYSHEFPFTKDEKQEFIPPFPTVNNYDAKAWKFIHEYAQNNALFWNVGQSPKLVGNFPQVDSNRAWGEVRDDPDGGSTRGMEVRVSQAV